MSVYAANRLQSISENSQFCEEILEAFNDTSKETSNITPMGLCAQIHENDLRMFDAIIATDFRAASLTESTEIDSLNEATGKQIWGKIKEVCGRIKEAIIALFRKIRDKVFEIVRADKKIVDKYADVIGKLPAGFKVTVKNAPEFKDIDSLLDSDARTTFDAIGANAGGILKQLQVKTAKDVDSEKVASFKSDIARDCEQFEKKISDAFGFKKDREYSAADVKAAFARLKDGKDFVSKIKKISNEAVKAIKEAESAAKALSNKKAEDAAIGNAVYTVIAGTGAALSKATNQYNNAIAKAIGVCRRVVLLAGRKALGEVKAEEKVEESFVDAYAADVLCECSDLYVANKFAMV